MIVCSPPAVLNINKLFLACQTVLNFFVFWKFHTHTHTHLLLWKISIVDPIIYLNSVTKDCYMKFMLIIKRKHICSMMQTLFYFIDIIIFGKFTHLQAQVNQSKRVSSCPIFSPILISSIPPFLYHSL